MGPVCLSGLVTALVFWIDRYEGAPQKCPVRAQGKSSQESHPRKESPEEEAKAWEGMEPHKSRPSTRQPALTERPTAVDCVLELLLHRDRGNCILHYSTNCSGAQKLRGSEMLGPVETSASGRSNVSYVCKTSGWNYTSRRPNVVAVLPVE